jgi:N-acetylneuraminic acid mutarotase
VRDVRWLRWLGGTLAVALAVAVVTVVGLGLTNPSEEDRQGWEQLADVPDPRGEVASTVVERDGREVLVVAGGYTGRRAATVASVHAFDPQRGAWEALPDLPEPRHHAGAAGLDGDLYVSGGARSATDREARTSLWVLRDGAEGWEELVPMPEGRESHRMVALHGRLHVIGARHGEGEVLTYDPDADSWSVAAPLPEPRHHLGVLVVGEEIWAVGGRDEDEDVLDAVHVWNPVEDTWRAGPALPFPVSAAAEGVLDGAIHLVGGEDPSVPGGEVLQAHLVLPQRADVWEEATPAPVSTHGAGRGVIGGRLFVAGGSARQGLLSPAAWTPSTAAYDPGAAEEP